MAITSEELNRNSFAIKHGTYEYTKVVPNTGSQSTTITTSGGQEVIFELSSKVYNFNKSILSFTLTPALTSAKYNWMFADSLCMLRQVQLYTRTGLYLVDIQDANRYTNMTLRHETRSEELFTCDNGADGSLTWEGIRKCNRLASANYRADGTGSQTNYLEPLYFHIGGSGTATPVVNCKIDLGKMKNTLFDLNKDLYFGGEVLYLRLVFAPSTQICFAASSATDPTSGTASYAGSIALSNITLYMAVEKNPDIEREMKNLVLSSGINMTIPVVYYNKQNLTSSSQNISLRYNNAHGARLLKIIHSPYHNSESSSTAYNHDCLADAKLLEFYTMVNNTRTSQFNFDTSAFDDWMVRKDRIKGSSIFGSDEYYFNFVNIEDFTSPTNLLSLPKDNYDPKLVEQGLDLLSQEVKWDCYMTTAGNALNHYIYAICQKYLHIGPTGISLTSVPIAMPSSE